MEGVAHIREAFMGVQRRVDRYCIFINGAACLADMSVGGDAEFGLCGGG
jgi:hypothetical protein